MNLNKLKTKGDAPHHRFGNLLPPDGPEAAGGAPKKKFCETLGVDGLPEVRIFMKITLSTVLLLNTYTIT